jgi:L-alanine-DL-glutamate epimerase-like enolase superfamily enzyme
MDIGVETYPFNEPVAITGWQFSEQSMVTVKLIDSLGYVGRGEAAGIYYQGETGDHMSSVLEKYRPRIEAGATRADLLELMPAGGARNAIDAAMWEIESLRADISVANLAGFSEPKPLLTTMTIGVDEPAKMAAKAKAMELARAIKLKLDGGPLDEERIRAVRAARPDVSISVDANQGWSMTRLREIMPTALKCGVVLIEQPLPVGEDEQLRGFGSPIPIAADESFQGAGNLSDLQGLYDVVNIKLDKCGGLTAGLDTARQARAAGFQLMVGNMGGSSLGMAPHWVLGQMCEYVDVDGPLVLTRDSSPPLIYANGNVDCPPGLWGAA